MDDALPSISSGAVGSRFVSEADLDSAKAKRDEQWKAAYARCVSSDSDSLMGIPSTAELTSLSADSARNRPLALSKMSTTEEVWQR